MCHGNSPSQGSSAASRHPSLPHDLQKDVNADFRGWRQHWKKLQDAGILAGLVSKYNPWAVGPTAQLLGGADGRML